LINSDVLDINISLWETGCYNNPWKRLMRKDLSFKCHSIPTFKNSCPTRLVVTSLQIKAH